MNEKTLTVAIIGCGQRGFHAYGRIMTKHFPDRFRITCLCDIDSKQLSIAGEALGVGAESRFCEDDEFFSCRRADVLIIATQDRDHGWMLIKGLELGYDILCEKPLTSDKEECEAMLRAQKRFGGKVIVCHVLRYAPAFLKAAELLASGEAGKLVCIESIEQVGYSHQAHSFVRGNWRREDETSPMIIAKCCHDLDLLQFYASSRCESVSSTGSLTYFRLENAPEGSADRCDDCKYADTCAYSTKRIYTDTVAAGHPSWMSYVLTEERPLTVENISRAVSGSPYGRCVFRCDNDVVDHQQTVMTFENGVTATLTMTGFVKSGGRIMTFHCTEGEIRLNEEEGYVSLRIFGGKTDTWKISELRVSNAGGHGGGDYGLISTLYDAITGDGDPRTSLAASVESHLMGICAEESRKAGGKLIRVHP